MGTQPTIQQQLRAAREALGLIRLAATGATEAALTRRAQQADYGALTMVATAQLAVIIGRAVARPAGLPADAVDQLLRELDVATAEGQITFARSPGLN
jgi:hypothetical protein